MNGMNIFLNKLKILACKIIYKFIKNPINYINGPETLPAPLSAKKEEELFKKLNENPEKVKEELVVHNLRLVVYIAKKFDAKGVNIEDLISIGTIGLIKAVNTFCPDKNIKLATYASRCIENEILMYLRKTNNLKSEISLDEPLNIDWDGNELLLCDILGSPADEAFRDLEQNDEKRQLNALVLKLPARERQIMQLRFGLFGVEAKTQKEIADTLGISQSYISRLEKRIINKLKKGLEKAV